MRSRTGLGLWACVLAALPPAAARAQETARSVFCVAVRTVPQLDQNNYVLGGTGPVYMTPNFQTDLPQGELVAAWRSYIVARHPVGYPGNPDDTCQPANTRRALIGGQHGDIRNLSVSWTPGKAAGN
jgi:hypothetical protein